MPAFFSDGSWRDWVDEGGSVLAAPPPWVADTRALEWQAEARWGFPVVAGYFVGPDTTPERGGQYGATPTALTQWMSAITESGQRREADRRPGRRSSTTTCAPAGRRHRAARRAPRGSRAARLADAVFGEPDAHRGRVRLGRAGGDRWRWLRCRGRPRRRADTLHVGRAARHRRPGPGPPGPHRARRLPRLARGLARRDLGRGHVVPEPRRRGPRDPGARRHVRPLGRRLVRAHRPRRLPRAAAGRRRQRAGHLQRLGVLPALPLPGEGRHAHRDAVRGRRRRAQPGARRGRGRAHLGGAALGRARRPAAAARAARPGRGLPVVLLPDDRGDAQALHRGARGGPRRRGPAAARPAQLPARRPRRRPARLHPRHRPGAGRRRPDPPRRALARGPRRRARPLAGQRARPPSCWPPSR